MFVVDSSVWIDYFANRPVRQVEQLEQAVRDESSIALCGPILQEVLQGMRSEADFQREWRHLMRFRMLEATRWTFLRAASLYRFLRRKGATINSFDTTIAAVCLENYLPLLTCNRRDFQPIAKYAGLKLA